MPPTGVVDANSQEINLQSPIQNMATPERDESDAEFTYSDFRVDIANRLYRNIGVSNADEFRELLRQDWIQRAYKEYSVACLTPSHDRDEAAIASNEPARRSNKTKSPHVWKLARVADAIKNMNPRYLGLSGMRDKTLWTEDDHDIQFMVTVVQGAMSSSNVWTRNHHEEQSIEAFCRKSLWLALWLRWLYKPGSGSSKEAQRLKNVKTEWMSILNSTTTSEPTITGQTMSQLDSSDQTIICNTNGEDASYPPLPHSIIGKSVNSEDGHDTPSPIIDLRSNLPAQPEPDLNTPLLPSSPLDVQYLWATAPHETPTSSKDNSQTLQPIKETTGSVTRGRFTTTWSPKPLVPNYPLTKSKVKNQAKGIAWLTEDAYNTYCKHRNARMADWGVSPAHSGTCILVGQEWTYTPAMDILQNFSWESLASDDKARFLRDDKSRLVS